MLNNEKIKCRFHLPGKCPKKNPHAVKLILGTGILEIEGRKIRTEAIHKILTKYSHIRLSKKWSIEADKEFVWLYLEGSNGSPTIVVNKFNRRFYSPEEIKNELQNSINICNDKASDAVVKIIGLLLKVIPETLEINPKQADTTQYFSITKMLYLNSSRKGIG